jgi:anti-sigma factor RsiW
MRADDNMDHQAAADCFSSYLEGDLPEAERLALEQHLGTCAQCRAELEAFRRTVGGLGALRRPAPELFLPRIQRQIFERSKGRFFGRRWLLFGRIPFEWVSLAMIIAMLVYYIAALRGAPTGVRPVP